MLASAACWTADGILSVIEKVYEGYKVATTISVKTSITDPSKLDDVDAGSVGAQSD